MSKTILSLILFTVSTTVIAVCDVRAQDRDDSRNLASFTVLRAKEGFESQFAEGYKAHLKWHVDNGERWNWLGWFVSSGERLGLFVDATFERSWSDFDNPLKPAGDRADLQKNVIPYADPHSRFTASFLPQFSNAKLMDLTARYQRVSYVTIRPGHEKEFRRYLSIFARRLPQLVRIQKFGWYRIEDGGPAPQYILMLAKGSYSDFAATDDIHEKLIGTDEALRESFKTSVQKIYTETFRYRPDLSYLPNAGPADQ